MKVNLVECVKHLEGIANELPLRSIPPMLLKSERVRVGLGWLRAGAAAVRIGVALTSR